MGRLFGFSTGALAKGDVSGAVRLQTGVVVNAIEISALRERELDSVATALQMLDLTDYEYVSLHAPSALISLNEKQLASKLATIEGPTSIVVHPNIIHDAAAWEVLGNRLCIENMDQRKPTGRTVAELKPFFDRFAHLRCGFCLDLGHAHQVDPTMGVAIELLDAYADRLRHLHVSEVDSHGRHVRMTFATEYAFSKIASLIPRDVPVIIESVVACDDVERELEVVERTFRVTELQQAS